MLEEFKKKLAMIKSSIREKDFNYFFLFLVIIIGSYLGWEIKSIIFFAIFIWLVLNPIRQRLFLKFALAFLAVLPLLLISKHQRYAEDFAQYALYFIALEIAVVVRESISKKQWKQRKESRKQAIHDDLR